jgi:hypothetical protein
MKRLAILALAATIAASAAAFAQNVTTTTTTVGNVPVTGAKDASPSQSPPPAASDSNPSLLNKLQIAQPALPTVTPPPSGDSQQH